MKVKIALSCAIPIALVLILSCLAMRNIDTPAGYVGYVTANSVFGKTHFVGLQQGPTSTGLHLFQNVINVSITPYSFDENFVSNENDDEAVVANDKLKVQFTAHVVWQIKSVAVRQYVDQYATIGENGGDKPDDIAAHTYANYLQPVIRTDVREAVEKYNGLELKDHMGDIGAELLSELQAYTANTPFVIKSINVGTIQPPANVVQAIAETQAKSQQISQKDAQIAIHRAMKSQRIAEAKGIEQSMKDLNAKGTLTPEYLEWEAIKAQQKMANSPNHSTVYFWHGVPLAGTVPITQPNAAASRKD